MEASIGEYSAFSTLFLSLHYAVKGLLSLYFPLTCIGTPSTSLCYLHDR